MKCTMDAGKYEEVNQESERKEKKEEKSKINFVRD